MPLRTVGAMLGLSEKELQSGRRVELRGVVTFVDPDWNLLTLQDETGGVPIEMTRRTPPLSRGDLLEVSGATAADNQVPMVVSPVLHVTGRSKLPSPLAAPAASLSCGEHLYRLVEIEVRPEQGQLGDNLHTARFVAHLACGDLLIIGRTFRGFAPETLAGRRVRVRGVPFASYAPDGRVDSVRLMFDNETDVDVLEPPAAETPAGTEAHAAAPAIRSARDVKALSREEAEARRPVELEGVVTLVNARHSGLCVQDGSTGLYVFLSKPAAGRIRFGDRVRVLGHTLMGGFAPVVAENSIEVLGRGVLPEPARIPVGDVFHGWEENLWVEIEGVVLGPPEGSAEDLELMSGSRRIAIAFSEAASPGGLAPYLDARIAVRGVYGAFFTAAGVFAGTHILATSTSMLRVLEKAPEKPGERTLASLSHFDLRGVPQHRIRVSGVVTFRDTSGRVYLQDGGDALRIAGAPGLGPQLHSRATAEGFLATGGAEPQLEHVRWIDAHADSPVAPKRALAETLNSGELDARLVAVEGFLESRRTTGGELRLALVTGRERFAASMEAPGSAREFPQLRVGALLRLTGICEIEPGSAESRRASLRLRTADDIAIVRPAPFWDERRAAYAALSVASLLVLALVWVAWLRRGLVKEMALRAGLEEQLLNAQKMESVGRLAGGVAHDFNNYLTVILGYTGLLLEKPSEWSSMSMALTTIREVSEKAAALTRQLLAFSRKQLLQPVPCDLNETLASARQTLLPLIGENIELLTRPAENLDPVNIDPGQFFQVIVNLAVNARDAMPHGGHLTFETTGMTLGPNDVRTREGLAPGRYVLLTVTDTGAGMDEHTRQHIFEPFFTTKEKGRGTGLGLSVVFGIVKQSGGHIEVSSRLGEGASFSIYLPVASSPPTQSARVQDSAPRRDGGGVTVLVVEDREDVRTLVATGLSSYGYDVLTAATADAAIEVLRTSNREVRVLLTDVVMPGRGGRELAADIVRQWPGIRVIFMSGHSEEILRERPGSALADDYLQKPFTAAEAAALVRRALDRKDS